MLAASKLPKQRCLVQKKGDALGGFLIPPEICGRCGPGDVMNAPWGQQAAQFIEKRLPRNSGLVGTKFARTNNSDVLMLLFADGCRLCVLAEKNTLLSIEAERKGGCRSRFSTVEGKDSELLGFDGAKITSVALNGDGKLAFASADGLTLTVQLQDKKSPAALSIINGARCDTLNLHD